MAIPQFKINITHSGTSTDYVNSVFSSIQVKRRENNYDVATLTVSDPDNRYYLTAMAKFDEIKIYFKDQNEAAYTQVFGGNIRQINPTVNKAGSILTLNCKGYGAALEETNCNKDYGAESANNTLDTVKEICEDLVDNCINKSLGSATNTGYAITKTKIADIQAATKIKYVNNPYRANIDALDLVCDMSSAIGAGTTAGAHWIVDNSKNLIVNTIGAHENTTEWPDWCNTNQADSTLTQGINFTDFQVLDKAEEFANNVVLITDIRKPSFDYWTEDSGGSALWGTDGLVVSNSNTQFVVGSHSLRFSSSDADPTYGYYPSDSTSTIFDVTKWGSPRTIPTINFYVYMEQYSGTPEIILSDNTTARKTDFYHAPIADATALGKWKHHSYPIGPYYKTGADTKEFNWGETGDPEWNHINTVEFTYSISGPGDLFYIDDLHFAGKIIRSAKDSHSIAAYDAGTNPTGIGMELQKTLISRNAMDDSCVASDDTGFAGRIAYAELLRRLALPFTCTFQIAGTLDMKAALAGQKLHIHACKKMDGTFGVDADMRILEIQHDLNNNGYIHTVTASSDLKNSSPTNTPDKYAMWQENMFLNSREAKNIRSGAEVDLLIPIIQKDYPS